MDLDFLGEKFKNSVSNILCNKLYELRLREGFPAKVVYDNKKCYLTENGITLSKNNPIFCEKKDIENIINCVTENSVYAFNDRIKEGYLTTKSGVRIGLVGECVFDDGKILTVKDVNSLNIRFPNSVLGCSDKVFQTVFNGTVKNTLIISPPRYGKTTILKDLTLKLNDTNLFNVLIIDERGEFTDVKGENIDSVLYSEKQYAFINAVRVMSPDVIITDELVSKSDFDCVYNAMRNGVKVVASCHGRSIENVVDSPSFLKGFFERYVVLDGEREVGKIKEIYNKELTII